MMDKVRTGQPWRPPKAADVNATAVATDLSARKNQNVGSVPPVRPERDHNCAVVKNDSGGVREAGDKLTIPRGASVKLLTDDNLEKIWLNGDLGGKYVQAFGILQSPAAASGYQRACLQGITYANVYIHSLEHDHALPVQATNGHVLVSSDTGPARILYRPASTGEQLCIIQIAHQQPFVGFHAACQAAYAASAPNVEWAAAAPGTWPTNRVDSEAAKPTGVGWTWQASPKNWICETPGWWSIRFRFGGYCEDSVHKGTISDGTVVGATVSGQTLETFECAVLIAKLYTAIAPAGNAVAETLYVNFPGMNYQGAAYAEGFCEAWIQFAYGDTFDFTIQWENPYRDDYNAKPDVMYHGDIFVTLLHAEGRSP